MKLFIFQYLAPISDRYHSDGGVVCVAQDLVAARELIKKHMAQFTDEEPTPIEDPTAEYAVVAEEQKLFIFPNAGCC